MGKLSRPRRADSIRPSTVDVFGGIDRRIGAKDGTIRDDMNMWGGAYPVLESRPGMKNVSVPISGGASVNSFVFSEGVLYFIGSVSTLQKTVCLYKWDGSSEDNAELIRPSPLATYSWRLTNNEDQDYYKVMGDASKRSFAVIANYVCIFPDMTVYDREKGELFCAKFDHEVTIGDGESVTIHPSNVVDGRVYTEGVIEFRADGTSSMDVRTGDVVVLEGLKKGSADTTIIKRVRGVRREKGDGSEYILIAFDDGTFTGLSVPETPGVKVALRRNPNLPYMLSAVEVNGRLWGYYKNMIYACALNDPRNWERFEGISTDAFTVEAPGEGEITGVCEWNGAPYFFKETGIIKIYGSEPSEFVAHMTKCPGLRAGNERSVALCGGALFWNSPLGIVRYAGSVPVIVSESFGGRVFRYAAGGSDGRTYFVSLWDNAIGDDGDLWAYDTLHGTWHRYAEGRFTGFAYDGALWALRAGSSRTLLILTGDTERISQDRLDDEGVFDTSVTFNDFVGSYGSYSSRSYYGRKGVTKVDLRLTLDQGVSAQVMIRYDKMPDFSGGWTPIGSFQASGAEKRTFRLPIIPRRCDHFDLRITTEGGHWVLHSLTVFKYQGTDIH